MSAAPSRLASELALARQEIREGRFERSMALMAAFAALVSGWEAYAQHLRGNFSHWLMWTPVALTPSTIVAAVLAIFSRTAARRVLPVFAVISLVDGVVGFVAHAWGVHRMPGGYRLGRYNLVMGPPIFAPLLTCTVGVLGVLASLSRQEVAIERPWERNESAVRSLRRLRRRGEDPQTWWTRLGWDVSHGRFQRRMAVLSAAFAVFAGGEAYIEHLRGSFNRWEMWTPVWLTPPMVLAGLGAYLDARVARYVLPLAAGAAFVDGVLGFLLHVQGIQRMPGGFKNLEFNFTMGPPMFAPLLLSSVGLLGFLAHLVRREDSNV